MSHRRIGESQRIDNLIDAPDGDVLDDCVSGQLADEQGGLGNIVGSELADNIVNAGRCLKAGRGRGGKQAGDAHAIGLQFSVKSFGEVQHAGLGCSVNAPLWPALAGADRGHIDDGAAALLLKDGRKYVCGVDHTVEIQLDGAVDFSLGLIDDVLDGNAPAGVVDKHVDAAVLFHDGIAGISPYAFVPRAMLSLLCYSLRCGASILRHLGGLYKVWDGLFNNFR